MKWVVTTVLHPAQTIVEIAHNIAEQLQLPFIVRGKNSLEAIKQIYQVDSLIVITKNGPVAQTPGGDFFFHLNMAELRIKNLINGKHDHMISAMGLSPGMSVLDCTLGLATDAIVASFITGTCGTIVGLETSPVISLITRYGLQNFFSGNDSIDQAMRRISVKNDNYHEYLPKLPENSFDIVFFDPMFRRPIQNSSNLKPLRYLADNRPLTVEAIYEAKRIAKQRVIIKETHSSSEFNRLGITTVLGGKYSSIQYGILEAAGGNNVWNV